MKIDTKQIEDYRNMTNVIGKYCIDYFTLKSLKDNNYYPGYYFSRFYISFLNEVIIVLRNLNDPSEEIRFSVSDDELVREVDKFRGDLLRGEMDMKLKHFDAIPILIDFVKDCCQSEDKELMNKAFNALRDWDSARSIGEK